MGWNVCFVPKADITTRVAAWRLQEMGSPLDDAKFGRCYEVFYNQIKLGYVQIWPTGYSEHNYYSEKMPDVNTDIKLN